MCPVAFTIFQNMPYLILSSYTICHILSYPGEQTIQREGESLWEFWLQPRPEADVGQLSHFDSGTVPVPKGFRAPLKGFEGLI